MVMESDGKLSQLSEDTGTPWTGCQSIAGPHINKQPHMLIPKSTLVPKGVRLTKRASHSQGSSLIKFTLGEPGSSTQKGLSWDLNEEPSGCVYHQVTILPSKCPNVFWHRKQSQKGFYSPSSCIQSALNSMKLQSVWDVSQSCCSLAFVRDIFFVMLQNEFRTNQAPVYIMFNTLSVKAD